MNKRGHVLNAVLLSIGLGLILSIDLQSTLTVQTALDAGLKVTQLFIPVVLGALFPDVDTAFGKHRKLLHNVFVIGIFVGYVFVFDNLHFVWIGVATHYVLDLVGSKRGLALFYPFSSDEFDLPVGVTTSSKYAGPVTVVISVLEVGLLGAFHYYVFSLDATAAQAAQAIQALGA